MRVLVGELEVLAGLPTSSRLRPSRPRRSTTPSGAPGGPANPGRDADDIEWMDQLDQRRRGGGHGPDHELLLATQYLTVSRPPRPGYVSTRDDGRPNLLAADDTTTAGDLLTDALARTSGPTLVTASPPRTTRPSTSA
jgi:hypothetical protein